MVTIILFIVLLLVLVVVHEAGHALAARATGCRVEEFGVGFPPRLWGRRIGETLFSVNLLPVGGFVRLTGEDDPDSTDPRAFAHRPFWARALILAAGVLANTLLAVVLFTIVAGLGFSVPTEATQQAVQDHRIEVVSVEENPAVKDARVVTGDVILSVNGEGVSNAPEAAARVRAATGSTLTLHIRRAGVEQDLVLRFDPPKVAEQRLGIALLDVGTVRVPWSQAPREGLRRTGETLLLTIRGFGQLLTAAFQRQEVPQDIAGPVGIAVLTGTVAKQGFIRLLEFAAVISVNLAFINVLPIPALDGGRLLFLFLERVGVRTFRGRPERLAHMIGFMLLLMLLVVITVSDVRRLLTTP